MGRRRRNRLKNRSAQRLSGSLLGLRIPTILLVLALIAGVRLLGSVATTVSCPGAWPGLSAPLQVSATDTVALAPARYINEERQVLFRADPDPGYAHHLRYRFLRRRGRRLPRELAPYRHCLMDFQD